MKLISTFFSRLFGYGAISAVFLLVSGVSIAIIASVMTTPEMRADAACLVGLDQYSDVECLEERFAAERARLEQDMAALQAQLDADRAVIDAERLRIERERADLEAMILDTDVVLFQAASPTGDGYVVVAASFRDAAAQIDLIGAACYYARDTGGPDPRLPLGRISSSQVLAYSVVDAARLDEFGIDAVAFDAMKRACPWPQV